MSQENVEIVRRYVEQYGEVAPKDTPRFTAEVWDPDGDYYQVRKFPEARPCHAATSYARFQAEYVVAGSATSLPPLRRSPWAMIGYLFTPPSAPKDARAV